MFPGVPLSTVCWTFLHQLAVKKMPHILAWRMFPGWGSLFSGISGLCQVDNEPTKSLNMNTEQEKLSKVKRKRKYCKAANIRELGDGSGQGRVLA